MIGALGTLTTVAAMLGAANAGYTLYEKVLRRPRLLVDQRFSWMEACGPDALVSQVDVRLRALHGDVYLHDVHFANLPGWWEKPEAVIRDPDELTRLGVPRFYGRFEQKLAYDLTPDAFINYVGGAGEGTLTQDLKIPAGGIMTITAAGVAREKGIAARARRCGWWLILDYGTGRAEEKVFHDL